MQGVTGFRLIVVAQCIDIYTVTAAFQLQNSTHKTSVCYTLN